MSDDPYKTLGVSKEANQDDIRAAYRKLAKQLHPDVNPGDKAAEDRFKKVSGAYNLLGDAEQRARFDRGEIDAEGQEIQRTYYRDYAGAGAEHPYHSTAGFEDLGEVFADLFGGMRDRRGDFNIKMRGPDVRYTMAVDFLEAVNGAKRRVTMPDGKTLDVSIPPGLRDGQILRLKAQGGPGVSGGPAGDAFIEVSIKPHPYFKREGRDIRLDLPVSISEALLGAKVRVPTATGAVTMTIPPHSNSGDVLRLKGKGVPGRGNTKVGDQLVVLKVILPDKPDKELEDFIRDWAERHAYNTRSDLGV